jgi:hypothetical protein
MNEITTRPTTPRRAQPVPVAASDRTESRRLSAAFRMLGALALLAVGAVHLDEYFADYFRVVPVIGPLFVLNFAGATALAIVLLLPLGRRGRIPQRLAALGGIGMGLVSIAFLLLSEHQPLFGFMDHGYRAAIVAALAAEAAAAVLLAAYLATSMRSR